MAGNGTRTKSLGEFKPFIKIKGKTVFEWFIKSNEHNIKPDDTFYIVTTKEFDEKFKVIETIKNILPNKVNSFISDYTPEGPAKSVSLALNNIDDDEEIIVSNCDQYIFFNYKDISDYMSIVCKFDLDETKSYIKTNNKFKPVYFIEKKKVSCISSTGIYIFKKSKILKECLKLLFCDEMLKHKGEFYISTSLNFLDFDKDIKLISCDAKFDLGSINSIKFFESFIESMRV